MKFDTLSKFQKEYKKLIKKYKSLPDDLQEFKNVVSIIPLGNSKHFHIITRRESLYIIKARLFCRYLKGTSLRIVYAYFEQKQRIKFIEIYHKGNRQNHNPNRIEEFLSNF